MSQRTGRPEVKEAPRTTARRFGGGGQVVVVFAEGGASAHEVLGRSGCIGFGLRPKGRLTQSNIRAGMSCTDVDFVGRPRSRRIWDSPNDRRRPVLTTCLTRRSRPVTALARMVATQNPRPHPASAMPVRPAGQQCAELAAITGVTSTGTA